MPVAVAKVSGHKLKEQLCPVRRGALLAHGRGLSPPAFMFSPGLSRTQAQGNARTLKLLGKGITLETCWRCPAELLLV